VHEIKLDGFRMAARIDNGRVQLLTRTGLDWTDRYPSAAAALTNVNVKTAYLDGELCGVDEAGLPSFARMQAATDGERGVHLVFYAFDLLHIGGWDISSLTLLERKALLEPLLANKPGLQYNGHEAGDGELILQTPASSASRAWSRRRSTPRTPQETVAYGATPKLSTGRSSAGRTRKDLGLISGRCCSATIPTTASLSMPAA
jgi:hypothetical protein